MPKFIITTLFMVSTFTVTKAGAEAVRAEDLKARQARAALAQLLTREMVLAKTAPARAKDNILRFLLRLARNNPAFIPPTEFGQSRAEARELVARGAFDDALRAAWPETMTERENLAAYLQELSSQASPRRDPSIRDRVWTRGRRQANTAMGIFVGSTAGLVAGTGLIVNDLIGQFPQDVWIWNSYLVFWAVSAFATLTINEFAGDFPRDFVGDHFGDCAQTLEELESEMKLVPPQAQVALE